MSTSESSARPPATPALVSVVVTCYNHARFLPQAIDSVLAQTYPHFEIVVVDDGSTDDTPAVLARYPQVRYIRQTNQGVSAARNRGCQETSGQHLVILDGDDRLLPGALAAGVNCLREHPTCGFVFGWCRLINAEGEPLPTPQPTYKGDDTYLALLHSNFIWMPAMVMFQRAAFERAGGFAGAADHSGDYELYLRLARQFPVRCHEQTVAEWRQHGANTSRNFALMLKRTLVALRAQKEFVRTNKRYEAAYRQGMVHYRDFYGDQVVDEIRAHVRRREWGKALRGALVLLRYHPRGLARHAARKISVTAHRIVGGRKYA